MVNVQKQQEKQALSLGGCREKENCTFLFFYFLLLQRSEGLELMKKEENQVKAMNTLLPPSCCYRAS